MDIRQEIVTQFADRAGKDAVPNDDVLDYFVGKAETAQTAGDVAGRDILIENAVNTLVIRGNH